MRKAQKQEVMECINSLHQAHIEIREALERKEKIAVQNMLSECQEFAVSIGESIEKLEGEGHATVTLLEGYCETVYRLYNELETGAANAHKTHKALRQQLLRVENSAKNDIPVRREVVFLPYKASMWDSLESVWMAADADPDCDAYVIPIPYFDKAPDGSFREMHYEGNEYPKNVPVVWYEDYDFEKRKPDIIFIHNPYDENNMVTSVMPFFYSNNLKKYTEHLVYIPYFTLSEINPDDQQEIERMKHFCLSPGVYNADKVIVQSEDMCQVYVNVMTEATGGEATRGYWEKKILGLGSPKFDKVMSTRKEDLEIPKEWLRIIEKSDGSWKKIIFYNTSVGALLQHGEQYLVKIRDVFQIFYENRDEVALLWRPHPLIKATIESMRPTLWAEYREIVAKYQDEGWGIYDDSTDMNRAVVLSDAYYGDGSSVAQLYHKINKPAMIQSMNCLPFDWNGLLGTYKMVENKGDVWIAAALFNGIFSLNVKSGEVEWKGKIPKEKDEIDNLFRDYIIVENKIYFAPTNAENIVIYDIEKEKYHILELNMRKYGKNDNYASVVQNGREILFIGICRTNIICKYSINTGEIAYIKPKAVERIRLDSYGGLYGFRQCIRDNILYVPLLKGGCALKINLRTEKTELLQLTEQADVAFTMAIHIPDRDVIWFVSRCGYIIQWNEKTQKKETIKFSVCSESIEEEYISYKLKKDKLYLFPRKCEMEYKSINIYTGECIEAFPSLVQVLDVEEIEGKDYYLGNKSDGRFYIICIDEKGIKEEAVIHRKDGRLGKECLDEYQIEFFKDKEPLYYEGARFQYGRSIEVYLRWIIANCDFPADEGDVKNVSSGKEIWKYLQDKLVKEVICH